MELGRATADRRGRRALLDAAPVQHAVHRLLVREQRLHSSRAPRREDTAYSIRERRSTSYQIAVSAVSPVAHSLDQMGLDVDGEGTALEALVPLAQHARRLLATAAARPVVLQKMKYLIEDRQIGCVAKTNIEMTTTTVMWCCKDGLITNETECKKRPYPRLPRKNALPIVHLKFEN
ncbi:hypothetical protein PRIPAC_92976 [Pristionchus pacificus]|uniref:Uncharacterized protein n=1 Tax=Pristionchus pacificus TaxID=54126 RepID=A0A2A6CI04_PRIPA|nr:hypothetical protein PRIPAC_92976 [Pristionchus pacificus]|eukprot:PDM77720.1 hypothetical protein PRIPAC_34587 [Pristionchus pacificus]